MEGREQQASVANEHRLAVERPDHLDAVPELANPRRPDEHAAERDLVRCELDVGLEALHLTAERVPVDHQVCEIEVLAIEHDHPGARAEDGARVGADRLVEAVQLGEAHDRRRLASREHEAVEALELLGKPHLDDVRAESAQGCGVLAEGALQREDADAHRPAHAVSYQPRTSSRSSSASELDEIPTIGSPRPAETSASTLASSKWVVASTIAFARRSG